MALGTRARHAHTTPAPPCTTLQHGTHLRHPPTRTAWPRLGLTPHVRSMVRSSREPTPPQPHPNATPIAWPLRLSMTSLARRWHRLPSFLTTTLTLRVTGSRTNAECKDGEGAKGFSNDKADPAAAGACVWSPTPCTPNTRPNRRPLPRPTAHRPPPPLLGSPRPHLLPPEPWPPLARQEPTPCTPLASPCLRSRPWRALPLASTASPACKSTPRRALGECV